VSKAEVPPAVFGFIVHPPSFADIHRILPWTRLLPNRVILAIVRRYKPYVVAELTGLRSPLGPEARGYFVGCPLLPRQMLDLNQDEVTGRVVAAARLAEKLGARIIGLGGYTSIVGDKGYTVARSVDVAVTSGNTLTAWASIEALRRLARARGRELASSRLAVVGATGSIGSLCARQLAPEVASIVISARHHDRLERLATELARPADIDLDARRAAAGADLVITTTSAPDSLFSTADLKSGAVVVDVSVPRNIAVGPNPRPDVIVADGGRIRAPGPPRITADLGLPPGEIHACMAETMTLALEGRYENYSLGDNLDPARMDEIGRLATAHGFEVVLPEAT
jgi:predicted amino acid dehydrogenase